MAHSIQELGPKHLVLNDMDVIAMVLLGTQLASSEPKFRDTIAFWMTEIQQSGPGTIDLHLDELVSSPTGLNDLVEVLQAIRTSTESFGPLIPAQILNDQLGINSRGIRFSDLQATLVLDCVDELLRLISAVPVSR